MDAILQTYLASEPTLFECLLLAVSGRSDYEKVISLNNRFRPKAAPDKHNKKAARLTAHCPGFCGLLLL
jgi:hypothetical protein